MGSRDARRGADKDRPNSSKSPTVIERLLVILCSNPRRLFYSKIDLYINHFDNLMVSFSSNLNTSLLKSVV